MFRRRSYRKKAAPKRKRAAGSKRKSVSVSVKKYVKAQIHRNIENKTATITQTTNFGNILQSPTLNAFPVLPFNTYMNIPLNVNAGGRIGNQVTVRKLMLNYAFNPMPYQNITNNTPQPMEIQCWLGHVKNNPCEIPVAGDFATFFNSAGASFGPTGAISDLLYRVNTPDYWVIKKYWTHKIAYSSYGGTGVSAVQQSYGNNDYKLNVVRRIDITKHVNKVIKFNDGANTPTTPNLFFFYQAVAACGTALGATQITDTINFTVDLTYEDA